MDPNNFFCPAGPNIVHEDFQDEIIAVNLDTGRYYSFNQAGGWLWSQLAGGCRLDELTELAVNVYAGDSQLITNEVHAFVSQLVSEELLCNQPSEGSKQTPAPATGDKQPFSSPRMEKYTDMQDLLMLDPIHEVDETGWPHPNPAGNPAAKA